LVKEINNKGDDVNKGQGGKFICTSIKLGSDDDKALSDILFIQSKQAQPKLGQDLAQGVGGDFRYLLPIRDPDAAKIDVSSTKMHLFCASSKGELPNSSGFTN